VKLVSKSSILQKIKFIISFFLEQKSKSTDNEEEDSDAEDSKTHVHDDEL
jgi:hypothetical protein